jgi:hypothetical protein
MPKYKLPNGTIVNVANEEVEAFLNSKDSKGAELIQEGPVLNEIESPVGGFFGGKAKTNAVVKPVATATAKQQPATNMASSSVNGSLGQLSNKDNKIKIPEPNKPVTQKEAESIFSYIDNINNIEDPIAKDVVTLLNGSEYDKTKNRFKRSNKEAKLFRQDAVEVTKAMRQMYKGLGLEFSTKLEEGFLSDISNVLFGPDVDDNTVVVSLGDKKINLETNTTDDNAYIRNLKKIEKLIVDNKKSINTKQWTSNISKTIEDYSKIESIDKASKEAEDKANKDFINNTALFEPVKKIVPAGGGMYGGYTPVTVVEYPYKKELDNAKSTLLNQNPKIDKEKLDELAKNIVRQNLAEDYVIEAKYSAREKAISNGDISQEMMYTTSSFMTSDKAEKYNESAKKAEISEEIAITTNSALNLAYKSMTSGLDDSEDLDLIEAIDKLGIPFDYSDASKVKLKNGREVNKQLLDAYSKLLEKNKAATINFNKYIDKAEQEATDIEDLNLSMEASSKNYDLSEKYLANIGVGFTDIGVGLLRTGAEVLRFDEDGALDDLGASYSEWSQDIRGSFVRDVAFKDAFSSPVNFIKFGAQEITNQIPIVTTLIASGGTAAPYVIGASSMGGKLNDMSYEIAKGTANYSKAEMYLKSLAYGGAEGLFSALPTSRILKNTKARWISSSKTKGTSLLDDGLKSWVKEKTPGLLLDTGMESFGEGLTTIVQNRIDGKPWYENIDHAAFSGFGFSLGMGGVPYVRGLYNANFSTYGSNEVIRDKKINIDNLSKRYNTIPDKRSSEAKVIKRQIKTLSDEVNDVILSNEKLVNNNLTYKGAEYILKIENKKAEIQNEAKKILEDESLSQDAKDLGLVLLKQKLAEIDNVQKNILNERSFKLNLVEFNAFKFDNQAKYSEYKDRAESFLIDEGFDNPKSELIEKKAQEYYFADEARKDNVINSKKDGVFNGDFKSFETKEEAVAYISSLPETSIKETDKITAIEGIQKGADGLAVRGTGVTIAIVENQVANQRKQTRTHEVGHQALEKILSDQNNTNTIKVIADQIKYTLTKTDKKLYDKFVKTFTDASEINDPREVVARFTELVASNEITFSERKKGIAGLFGAMVQKKFSDKYDFNFRGENDIFNFVVGFGKKLKSGDLTIEDIQAAKESGAIKTAIELGSKTKTVTTEGVSLSKATDIETKIEELTDRYYDGEIDDIDYEQQLDNLQKKLEVAQKEELAKPQEIKKPKKAEEDIKQQENTVKESVEKFKKEVSEETISDKNKNIAKINEDIANEMLELGANKVTDIKDPVKQKEIIDKLGRNNLGAVTNLTKKATAAGKDLAIDDNSKVGYDEFFSGFSEELSALIKSYKVEVDGEKVPFGAYMNKNLPLRYGQILDKALKGGIEGGFKEDVETARGIISEETQVEEGEVKEKILIDPRKSRIVKDKLPEIEESIDIDPATVTTLTFKNVAEKFGGIVGAKIFDIPVKKVSDPTANLTYATKIVDGVPEYSEAGNIQNAFTNPQQAKEFIKLLPEFNIAGNEVEVSETGEIIDVSSSAKGYAIGVPNNLIKLMYNTYVDPRSLSDSKTERSRAITSPKGRSKGLTSQATVYRLKPEFTGTISNEAVTKFQNMLGITEKGKLNKYDREIGQVLKSAAKLYGSEVANIIVRDKINKLDIKTSKSKSQVLADIAAGKSSVMFSKAAELGLDVNIEGVNDKTGVLFSKGIAKLLVDTYTKNTYKELDKRKKQRSTMLVLDLLEKGATQGIKYFEEYINSDNLNQGERDLVNHVFEGRDWLFGIFSDGLVKNNGLKYEKIVRKAIKEANIKDVKIDLVLGKGGFDTGTDLVLSIKGKKTNIELKLNSKVRMGSFLIGETNGEFYYTKGVANLSEKLPELHAKIQESLRDENRIKAKEKYVEEGLAYGKKLFEDGVVEKETTYDETKGVLRGPNEVFEYLRKKGLQNKLTIDIKGLDQSIISLIYNNKDVYNIEFGDKGLYFLNENKNGLPIPELKANVKLQIITTKAKNYDGTYRTINRAVPYIDSELVPSTVMLTDVSSIKETIEYIRDNTGSNISFSKNLSEEFNKIIENKTGIAYDKTISEVKAKMIADSKRNFNFFIPPSAEDFVGLLYYTLGKGKTGEKQMQFYKRTLLDPYARANQAISRDRNSLGRRFKEIKKEFKVTPKDLKNRTPDGLFTREQAVRVFIWNSIGKEIPGLSKKDVKELVDYVKSNRNLSEFATQVMMLNPGKSYTAPTDTWITGNITTDLLEVLNTSRRAMHLKQWQQNVDAIFSNENLNKLEAAYGTQYREAMKNILKRMKTGRNRTYGTDTLTGRFTDWVNGSVGAIMFLNTRSAVLQTISAVNFINFTDNNVLAAGKALANQKQYWSDFATLFKSEYLVDRRDGLKVNVNEADIADIAKEKGIRGALNYLLKLGFTPTQIADSFAIASGGATFYRNRIKSLIKKGMDPVAAEKLAMRDFIETAEESQQSSRPDKISQQQAGPLGRIVLAFANTPAQYARLIKKAASDLKNGRGDAKTNISKILYYGAVQNIIFNALQQALFAMTFGDEEEESEKTVNIINGTIDGIARGTGLGGAVFTVVKNTALKLYRDSEKKNPKFEDGVLEMLKISPPISSKVQKLRAAGRTMSWDMDEIKEKGASFDNPAIMAGAKVTSAMFNFPADRVVQKVQNLVDASDSELETYKRLALVGGWSAWELGIKEEEKKKEAKNKSTKRRSSVKKSVLRKTIIR